MLKKCKISKAIVLFVAVVVAVVFVPFTKGIVVHADDPVTLIVDPVNGKEKPKRAEGATYTTIYYALKRATAGDTIKLVADVTESVSDKGDSGKSIIIDLNDHVLTGAEGNRVVYTDKNMVIKDDSSSKTTRYFVDSDGNGSFETCLSENPGGTEGVDYITTVGGVITGGTAKNGAGIYSAISEGTLTLTNISIIGNDPSLESGTAYGGGIYIKSGNAVISGCKVSGNRASSVDENVSGGGIYTADGTDVTITNTEISYNTLIGTGTSVSTHGAGITNNGNMSLTGSTVVKNNTASLESVMSGTEIRYAFGGGIYNGKTGNLTITDDATKVLNNKASATWKSQGGGIYNTGVCTLTGGEISGNISEVTTAGYEGEEEGGGICHTYNAPKELILGGSVKITGNTRASDKTANNLYLRSEDGAVVGISDTKPTTMSVGVTTTQDKGAQPTTEKSVPITLASDGNYSSYFSSDNSDYRVINENNTVKLIARYKVVVKVDNKKKTVGEANPKFTATVTGLQGQDKIQYTIPDITATTAGVYNVVATGDEIQKDIYKITYESGTLTVVEPEVNAPEAEPTSFKKIVEKYAEENPDDTVGIEIKSSKDVDKTDKEMVAKQVGTKKVEFFDTELWLILNGVENKNIGAENDVLVGITYHLDLSDKKDLQVFRVHEDTNKVKTLSEIKTQPNELGEYYTVNKEAGTVTVYAKQYSTYAFSFNDDVKTGDISDVWMYFMIMFAVALGLVATLKFRKRRTEK